MGIVGRRVVGVLFHQGIAQHKEVVVECVDMQVVGDAFFLTTYAPIAKTNRGTMALGHRPQEAVGAGIPLRGVVVHGVARESGLRTVVDCRLLAVCVIASNHALGERGIEIRERDVGA